MSPFFFLIDLQTIFNRNTSMQSRPGLPPSIRVHPDHPLPETVRKALYGTLFSINWSRCLKQ